MAKSTFKNLPQDKQGRILKAAAGLFARSGFEGADVAKIAAAAGVAKGSIYNYWSSKDELYIYVCRDGLEKSRKAVYGGIEPDWDAYRQIRHIFEQGGSFADEHPEYILMYLNVTAVGMERFADRVSREVEKYTADHLKALLKRDLEKGLVRKDIDVNVAAHTINGLYILYLLSLVSRHFQIRFEEYLEIEGGIGNLNRKEVVGRTVALIDSLLKPI